MKKRQGMAHFKKKILVIKADLTWIDLLTSN